MTDINKGAVAAAKRFTTTTQASRSPYPAAEARGAPATHRFRSAGLTGSFPKLRAEDPPGAPLTTNPSYGTVPEGVPPA